MRVALLTNILPPYRVPVFRALAETPGWHLRVLLNATSEFDRDWELDAQDLDVELLTGVSWVLRGRTLHLPWSLPAALRRFAPDVVVSGELGARSLLAWLCCRWLGVPLVLWTYPPRVAAGRRPGPLRRFLLRRGRAVIGMGRQARESLLAWGVPGPKIFDAANAHDAEGLRKALERADPELCDRALRAGLHCRSRVALVVGRLLPSKGIRELLQAWDLLEPTLRGDWSLLFVGAGPLEEEVRQAQDTHLQGEVVHVPPLLAHEIFELYAAADLLIFPSLSDPWGLVVNEAMASGLPVLCSGRAGCSDDLIEDGENGWLFDPIDPGAASAALRRALTCGRRSRLGERARATATGFEPARMAAGMRRAIEAAQAGPATSR